MSDAAKKSDKLVKLTKKDFESDQDVRWCPGCGDYAILATVQRAKGARVGHVHLRHLNPLPKNLGEVLKRFKRVVVPEMNLGQLLWVLRAKYLIEAEGLNKVQGKPFMQHEIEAKIEEVLGEIR